MEVYCEEEQPGVIPRGLDLTARRPISKPSPSHHQHLSDFSTDPSFAGDLTEAEYLAETRKLPCLRESCARSSSCLGPRANPAFESFRVLFDDTDLKTESPYVPMLKGLEAFFATQPPFTPLGLTPLRESLCPDRACPTSLKDQIDYIRTHWAHFLPQELLERAQLALDVLEEEQTLRGLGPGPSEPLRFDREIHRQYLGYAETAAFSEDADWMSNVVLIAKTVYVWLDQLSGSTSVISAC